MVKTVRNQIIHIIYIDGFNFETVQSIANDTIHAFELFLAAELNFSEHDTDRNNKLYKNLMIQIFYEAAGIIFTFLTLHGFDPMGIEHRQYNRNQENNNQTGKRKIFDQPKRLDSFF